MEEKIKLDMEAVLNIHKNKALSDAILELSLEFDQYAPFEAAKKNLGTFGYEDRILHKEELLERMKEAYENYLRDYQKGLDEIEKIEDQRVHTIFIYRYFMNLTWKQIAMKIGGKNTMDSVKKRHDRFLWAMRDCQESSV